MFILIIFLGFAAALVVKGIPLIKQLISLFSTAMNGPFTLPVPCSHCMAIVSPDQKVCPQCGAEVTIQEETVVSLYCQPETGKIYRADYQRIPAPNGVRYRMNGRESSLPVQVSKQVDPQSDPELQAVIAAVTCQPVSKAPDPEAFAKALDFSDLLYRSAAQSQICSRCGCIIPVGAAACADCGAPPEKALGAILISNGNETFPFMKIVRTAGKTWYLTGFHHPETIPS